MDAPAPAHDTMIVPDGTPVVRDPGSSCRRKNAVEPSEQNGGYAARPRRISYTSAHENIRRVLNNTDKAELPRPAIVSGIQISA
jgi:hypothetical protein